MGQIKYQCREQDGQTVVEEIHRAVVHTFQMSDVDDPDLYAADPLWRWQESDPGQFVMQHAVETPEWHRQNDFTHLGWRYVIIAKLEKKKLSEFYLRWGRPNGNN